jgi:hypothetical protein
MQRDTLKCILCGPGTSILWITTAGGQEGGRTIKQCRTYQVNDMTAVKAPLGLQGFTRLVPSVPGSQNLYAE